jgi:hypothetical protein
MVKVEDTDIDEKELGRRKSFTNNNSANATNGVD